MEYVVLVAACVLFLAIAITSELNNDTIVEQFERQHGVVICLGEKEYHLYRYHRPNVACMSLEYRRSMLKRHTATLLFTTPKALTTASPDIQRRVLVAAARQKGVNPYRVISCAVAT